VAIVYEKTAQREGMGEYGVEGRGNVVPCSILKPLLIEEQFNPVVMAFYLSIQDFRLSQRIVQDKTGYRHVSFGQCCGFGTFIPDPGSRIQDPKTSKKRGVKKNYLSYLFL
jgi:hypothetical protein